MIIALDLDGTAVDNNGFIKETLMSFLRANEVNTLNGVILTELPYSELWVAMHSNRLYEKYCKTFGTGYIWQNLAYGLTEFLDLAKSHGDVVDIVTSRCDTFEYIQEEAETVEFVRKTMPQIRNIYTGCMDKTKTITDISADWLIDDFHKHIDDAAKCGVNTIQMVNLEFPDTIATNFTALCRDFFDVANVIYGASENPHPTSEKDLTENWTTHEILPGYTAIVNCSLGEIQVCTALGVSYNLPAADNFTAEYAEEKINAIKEAICLIRQATELGILCMPDEKSVMVCVDYDGDFKWEQVELLSGAISLLEDSNAEMLKDAIEQAEIVKLSSPTVYTGDIDTILTKICEEYSADDVEIDNWFSSHCPDLSIADTVKLYAKLQRICNGDRVIRLMPDCEQFETLATGDIDDLLKLS